MRHYILDADGNPVLVDLLTWAEWSADAEARRVARTDISPDVYVSTVFLGIDHPMDPNHAPILWESMTFGGPLDGACKRYTSRQEAEAGHSTMVASVQNYKPR
jgi:hypothetical protein